MIASAAELASAYIPEDRRRALAHGEDLPHTDVGAVLFADISGFTPLTAALAQQMGPRRGAERLTLLLNQVYTALIAAVHRNGGSVIGFSGDAITCWFSEADDLRQEAGAAQRATVAAIALQAAMTDFADVTVTDEVHAQLALRVAIAAGPVLRCVVGDPVSQCSDVIAGATVARVANLNELAARGEIIVDEQTLAALPAGVAHAWRHAEDGRGAVLAAAINLDSERIQVYPSPELVDLPPRVVQPWLLPTLFARLEAEPDRYLAELRPAAALFINFAGIDYDADPAAAARLDAFVRWVQTILAQYEGALIQLTTGDKGSYLYAAFGAPITHDDDVLRAVAAGLALIQPPPALGITDLRAGLAQGMMRVGPYGSPVRRTYGVIGDATNLGARLMMRAAPGQLLLSAEAAALVAGHYRLEDLGLHQFKGKATPQQVYAATGARVQPLGGVAALYAAPLVGRSRELAIVEDEIAQVAAGRGRYVRIVGEPGAGKSHLAAHGASRAAAAGLRVIYAACQSTTVNAAYYAAGQWLRALLGLADGETRAGAAEMAQATAALASLNPQWLRRMPLLANLLGLPIADNELTAAFDARLRQEALTSLVVEATLASARRTPLLLLLEDVHWMDEASQSLLLALARVAGSAPLLLLTVQRPAAPGAEGFLTALAEMASARHLRLGDLDQTAAAELARRRLGGAVDALTADFIHAQAQGNPFFVEELADNLRESGALQQSAAGWTLAPTLFGALRAARAVEQRAGVWRLLADAPLSALQLGAPPSLHGLILARLDRLPESARLTLKVASVIGRVFEGDLLAAAHPARPDAGLLAGHVALFQQREFARLEQNAQQPVYIFKHNITQEVVYGTLLEQQQQELHQAVARALEERQPAAIERLAHHYQQSDTGQPAVRAKSLHYLELAARRAQHDYANETALRYFRAALALEERSGWRVEEARLLHLLGERVEEAAVLARLAALPDAPQPATAFLRADYAEAVNAYDESRAALQAALALAADSGDRHGEVQALAQLGQLALRQGDLVQAQGWYAQALAGLGDADLPTPAAGDVAFGLGVVYRQQTDFAAAEAQFGRALRCYAGAGRRADEAKSYTALGTIAFFRKDNATALDLFRQALTIRRDIGDRQGEGSSLLNIAQALGATGDFGQAQDLLRSALAIQQAIGNRWWENRVWNELGVLALLVGDWAGARANLARALALSSAIGDEAADLITLLNLALTARGEGRWAAAETELRRCLVLAQRQADAEGVANCQTELGLLYADAGAWESAETCAASALATYLALDMPAYAVTNHSTLALAHLHAGRLAAASAAAAAIEPLVRATHGDGIDYPQRDCWVCAQVWRATGRTAAADDMLALGRAIIAARAARISDPALRAQFLRAAPYHGLYR